MNLRRGDRCLPGPTKLPFRLLQLSALLTLQWGSPRRFALPLEPLLGPEKTVRNGSADEWSAVRREKGGPLSVAARRGPMARTILSRQARGLLRRRWCLRRRRHQQYLLFRTNWLERDLARAEPNQGRALPTESSRQSRLRMCRRLNHRDHPGRISRRPRRRGLLDGSSERVQPRTSQGLWAFKSPAHGAGADSRFDSRRSGAGPN